jgi:hypothetical protein
MSNFLANVVTTGISFSTPDNAATKDNTQAISNRTVPAR